MALVVLRAPAIVLPNRVLDRFLLGVQRVRSTPRKSDLGGHPAPQLDPHLVEARGQLAPRAVGQEERVMNLCVVGRRMRTIKARTIQRELVSSHELVPTRVVEVRERLVKRDVLEALDARLSFHTCPFVAVRWRPQGSISHLTRSSHQRKDQRKRDASAGVRESLATRVPTATPLSWADDAVAPDHETHTARLRSVSREAPAPFAPATHHVSSDLGLRHFVRGALRAAPIINL
jgi:hypothetical protein